MIMMRFDSYFKLKFRKKYFRIYYDLIIFINLLLTDHWTVKYLFIQILQFCVQKLTLVCINKRLIHPIITY